MVEKVTVEVMVPCLGKTLEFSIPSEMIVKDAYSVVLKMISEDCNCVLDEIGETWLIDLEAKKTLPKDAKCNEAGLKNGSKLMLIFIN